MHKVLGRTITHVSTVDPVVALTFDDGPHPEFTPDLLRILRRHQACATFFMIGEAAQCYPDLVRQVAESGHAIGNHSWDHSSFPLISGRERRAQIRACEKAISPYGVRLFRPPFGHQNLASHLDALLLGYQVVTWNIIVPDWLDHNARWIAERIIEKIRPGSVILLHDRLHHSLEKQFADRQPTLEAVNKVLTEIGNRFRFITLPEMLQHGRRQRQMWYMKPDSKFLSSLKNTKTDHIADRSKFEQSPIKGKAGF